jgi:ubiquinone/menaquinone biosynthesis C-methylase UbiE
MSDDPSFAPFNRDVEANRGYLYTTHARLSSRLANRRLTQATLDLTSLAGKHLVDIGCGDGTYTRALYDEGHPASVHGIDPAISAIEVAINHPEARPITYEVQSAYDLSFDDDSFDVAYLRGVLHHMDRPFQAIKEAFRVAPTIVIIEPNGYNPVLKLLERYSSYHVAHGEKSYSSRLLDQWVTDAGGRVEKSFWAGLVPMFCPDWLAKTTKLVEPLVERLPVVNRFCCAVYVSLAVRPKSPQ